MTAPLWQHGVVAVIAAAAVLYLVRKFRAKRGNGACADCAARARAARRRPSP
jgi:hypothetical protein